MISDRLQPLASWIGAISPLSMPFYASASLLSLAELTVYTARSVPRAFYFLVVRLGARDVVADCAFASFPKGTGR
jgi:hypothetical protein